MRLAILGASGHGKVVACAAEEAGWSEIVFFDDAWPEKVNNAGWDIVGNGRSLLGLLSSFDGVVVAIGNNRIRLAKSLEIAETGGRLVSVIHPSAVVSKHAQLGHGTVVFAGAVVNAGARIGRAVILNTCSSVDHDCLLEDGVHVSPGAHLAGTVRVGACAWIGIGSCVRQGVAIGDSVVVGAGAAVLADVVDGATVVGVPARRLG